MAHIFYYSGPLLYHTELNKDDLNSLKKICLKDKTKDFRKDLAGHLDHEYTINIEKFNKIIEKYLFEYKKAFEHWYGRKITKFETISSWVNFMKAGDFNPPHTHKSKLTCVLYVDVPLKLKEENKNYIGSGHSGGPGSINFTFYASNILLNNNAKNIFPKTGDFFIFPASLMHSVSPFKSKIERISVSANFEIETT